MPPEGSLFHLVPAGAVLVIVAVTSFVPSAASARRERVLEIPNGNRYSCRTCHDATTPTVLNGSRNLLGQDLEQNFGLTTGNDPVVWSLVWERDSDGDGQLNGEELGDPCGEWVFGTAPLFRLDLSNPGETSDTNLWRCGDLPPDGGIPQDGGADDAGRGDGSCDDGTDPPRSCCDSGSGGFAGPLLLLLVAPWMRKRR